MGMIYVFLFFLIWIIFDHIRTHGFVPRGESTSHDSPEREAFWAAYDGASRKFQDILAMHSDTVSSTCLLRAGLCGACGGGSIEIVRLILSLKEQGADARCTHRDYTPLHYVAGVVDPDADQGRGWFFPKDSPTKRYGEVAALLLQHGADPTVRDTHRQLLPLDYARKGRPELIPYLTPRS